MTEDLQAKFAAKIAALLRKAESTTPEEAEALTEKAQELMSKYAIEQALIDGKRKSGEQEKVVVKYITYLGSYSRAYRDIGVRLVYANDCKPIVSDQYGAGPQGGRGRVLHVIGFEGDVERVIALDASIQIQAAAASQKFGKTLPDWYSSPQKSRARKDFLAGYATGLGTRLNRAKESAKESVQEEQVAAGSTAEESSESVSLVLRSRKERIDDWVDETYGSLRKGRASRRSVDGGAYGHGRTAGLSADTGSGGGLRQRGALKA